jgi:hypothetical protein
MPQQHLNFQGGQVSRFRDEEQEKTIPNIKYKITIEHSMEQTITKKIANLSQCYEDPFP